jgi:hypothetical protein
MTEDDISKPRVEPGYTPAAERMDQLIQEQLERWPSLRAVGAEMGPNSNDTVLFWMEGSLGVVLPITEFPRLADASPEAFQRQDVQASLIHWPDLGETVDVRTLLARLLRIAAGLVDEEPT